MKKIIVSILVYIIVMIVFFFFIYTKQCEDSYKLIYKIGSIAIYFFPIILIIINYHQTRLFLINLFVYLNHIIIVIFCFLLADNHFLSTQSTIIFPSKIIKKEIYYRNKQKDHYITTKGYGIFERVFIKRYFTDKKVGDYVYMRYGLECSSGRDTNFIEIDSSHLDKIHDFAFTDRNFEFYTYHDFSLIKPDLVYYQVGFNVVYNAICDTTTIIDSTAFLSFYDVLGKHHSVKYSVNGYPTIPDTFLVYRNVNEKIDTKWRVCAPEVNTPENRAKISDYGYIFHYDVCSKQEIESQCPQIKEYVEQYKKRMATKAD